MNSGMYFNYSEQQLKYTKYRSDVSFTQSASSNTLFKLNTVYTNFRRACVEQIKNEPKSSRGTYLLRRSFMGVYVKFCGHKSDGVNTNRKVELSSLNLAQPYTEFASSASKFLLSILVGACYVICSLLLTFSCLTFSRLNTNMSWRL